MTASLDTISLSEKNKEAEKRIVRKSLFAMHDKILSTVVTMHKNDGDLVFSLAVSNLRESRRRCRHVECLGDK